MLMKKNELVQNTTSSLFTKMVLIHSFSKLEIETQHPHSSSSSSQKEERNWLDLPTDVMSLILLKLGPINILASAQWVCTSWWKLSKQPHLFSCIHVERFRNLFVLTFGRHRVILDSYKLSEMAKEAIDRSCGQLVKFSIRAIGNDELLHYMSEKSSSLRCLRLVNGGIYFTGDEFMEIAKKLPKLQELEIIQCAGFSKDVIETFGRFCPQLKLCWIINPSGYWYAFQEYGLALAIAQKMPELHHLNLLGNSLTDDDLRAILDGCPHLESLDLRRCIGLEFRGDLKKRCGNIKTLRLPDDPTDDFEYDYEGYESDSDYPCYADVPFTEYPSDYEGYESDSDYPCYADVPFIEYPSD